MQDKLKKILAKIPHSPGVYKFLKLPTPFDKNSGLRQAGDKQETLIVEYPIHAIH
jgi:hypothetical protein